MTMFVALSHSTYVALSHSTYVALSHSTYVALSLSKCDVLPKPMKSYYVYILRCADGSYYTGVTNDIERRLYEHQEGLISGCYTHNKRPVKLVYGEESTDVLAAISREKQIKGWSRRKKEALITNNYQKLRELSRNRSEGDPSTGSG